MTTAGNRNARISGWRTAEQDILSEDPTWDVIKFRFRL